MKNSQSVETLLREALTDIRNRILCPVGPEPSLDLIAEIASTALQSIPEPLSNWSEEELTAIAELCAEKDLSQMQLLRCALRHYQLTEHRLKSGETVTWSGDAQRAADFAGPLAEPLSDEGLAERHAELQHWFFQKLNPEQRTAFLFAAGVAPRTCDLTLGMQHQALRQVSAALSIPRLEAGRVTEAMIEAGLAAYEKWGCIFSDRDNLEAIYLAMSSTSAPDGEDQ